MTFAIHAENVQYNLIKMQVDETQPMPNIFDPDKYRIFSQLKREAKAELLPALLNPETDTIDVEHNDAEEALQSND